MGGLSMNLKPPRDVFQIKGISGNLVPGFGDFTINKKQKYWNPQRDLDLFSIYRL